MKGWLCDELVKGGERVAANILRRYYDFVVNIEKSRRISINMPCPGIKIKPLPSVHNAGTIVVTT